MKQYGLIVGVIVLGAAAAGGAYTYLAAQPEEKACTLEAKICPDGSAVGRVGPNCEFAECPEAGTTGTGGSILPYNSGVKGRVSLGPICPVMKDPPDPQCADKPYATSITVYRTGVKTPFLIGSSNNKGTFQFSMPPGSYMLVAGDAKVLPRCATVDVTVEPTGYTDADISCDTGIR